jgi:hypothetical protein
MDPQPSIYWKGCLIQVLTLTLPKNINRQVRHGPDEIAHISSILGHFFFLKKKKKKEIHVPNFFKHKGISRKY